MKKFFQFKNGQVKSYSNGKLNCDKLEQIELNITKSQLDKIESNQYNLFIKDDELVLIEGDAIIRQREREKKDKEITGAINKITDKYPDLVEVFNKLRGQ